MDWYITAFELIDMRSFSNLWYWIMLAVIWSTASHFVLGVPYDVVTRAGSGDAQAQADLQDLVRVHTNRIIYIADTSGHWLVGFAFFLLTGLLSLGFVYRIELCQAIFLIATPMTIVFSISVRAARRLRGLEGLALRRRLRLHRVIVQVIGMLSILVTSMWGMFINLSSGVLGN